MFADFFIIISAFISFIIFILIELSIVRIVDNSELTGWLGKVQIIGAGCNLLISLIVYYSFVRDSEVNLLIFIIMSFIIYFSGVTTIFGMVFGVSFTSVRTQVLNIICRSGKKGLTYPEILKQYNKEIIIKERLARLVKGKEIDFNKGNYYNKKKFSFMRLNYRLFDLTRVLYSRYY